MPDDGVERSVAGDDDLIEGVVDYYLEWCPVHQTMHQVWFEHVEGTWVEVDIDE